MLPTRLIFSIAVATCFAGCGNSATPQTAPDVTPDAAAGDAEPQKDATTPPPPPGDASIPPPGAERSDTLIDDGWRFHKGEVSGFEAASFDDSSWDAIHLPHTWNATDGQTGGNAYYRGIGVYRRHATFGASFAGKRIFIKLDGSNLVTDVFVNGKPAGTHKGGYAAFAYDVTKLVDLDGDNVIAVKVDNAAKPDIPPLSADFTFFGGMYRDAHLIVTDPVHVDVIDFASPGVYLSTSKVTAASADLSVAVRVTNDDAADSTSTVHVKILDADGKVVTSFDAPASVPAASTKVITLQQSIPSPHLWNGREDPYLYHAKIELENARGVVDAVTQPLGFRGYAVDANTGFSLNGKALNLHGVNRHQDRLDMGWAITSKEHDEDFALIEEMGCNAIRLAHYEHAQHFYDLADAHGMAVWAEIPLVNSITNSPAFTENAKQQLTELIRQNYNHPSIFFWSIANEISLVPGPDYNALLDTLSATVHSEDKTRVSALASTGSGTDAPRADVAGYNRYHGWYYGNISDFGGWADNQHKAAPNMKFGITEYGAGSSIKYHSETPKALDHTEEYQSLFHEGHWAQMKARPYLWGDFVWNMFDFASATRDEGDTSGRNDKGLVTYDRKTRKDAFYFYKAAWGSEPFVYITSRRFTTRTPATIDVKVYAIADSVELSLNGKSLGQKTSTNGIFVFTGVKLAAGSNAVKATGTKGNVTVTDDVTWTH